MIAFVALLLMYTALACFHLGRALLEIATAQYSKAAVDLGLCVWLMFLVGIA